MHTWISFSMSMISNCIQLCLFIASLIQKSLVYIKLLRYYCISCRKFVWSECWNHWHQYEGSMKRALILLGVKDFCTDPLNYMQIAIKRILYTHTKNINEWMSTNEMKKEKINLHINTKIITGYDEIWIKCKHKHLPA